MEFSIVSSTYLRPCGFFDKIRFWVSKMKVVKQMWFYAMHVQHKPCYSEINFKFEL